MSESTSEVLRDIVNSIRKTVYLPLRKKISELILINFMFYSAILVARDWISAMREFKTLVVKSSLV